MALTIEELENVIRSLKSADRDRLLRGLVADLDDRDEEQEIASAWLDEAQQRLAELQSGAVKGVPVDDVLQKARARLKHGN